VTEPSSHAVVIGASAGAVQALLGILPNLSDAFPYPILITVHVPPDRDNLLVPLLQERCVIEIKEAEDKEPIRTGVAYFAPSDYHLLVEKNGTLALSSDETVNYSRPSIDVLFESAADAYGDGLTGIILTGANEDGARGLEAIRRHGGDVIVEQPDHAYAAAMPEAAIQACLGARTMTLAEIAEHLARLEAP
jgi:two-component system chemotaxis response regulator CheB